MSIDRKQLMQWSTLPQMATHQAAWWACVLVQGWIGPMSMGLFVALHLWMLRQKFRSECVLIVLSCVVGIGLDNALAILGDVQYQGEILVIHSPLWLVSIWAGFGATVRHCQAVLFRTRWAAAVTGLVGGPLAYWGGERLGVLDVHSLVSWLDIGILWMAAMLTLHSADRHLP